jgi:hypothetical protein
LPQFAESSSTGGAKSSAIRRVQDPPPTGLRGFARLAFGAPPRGRLLPG